MIQAQFKKLDPRAQVPRNAYGNDAGWDLFALEDTKVPFGIPTDVRTGIAVAIPDGYYGRIVQRSSAPRKKGVMVMEGIIDAGFRGELFSCTFAWSSASTSMDHLVEALIPREIKAGDSIAQLIVQEVKPVRWVEVSELPVSERGERGFGSSG